MLLWYHKLHTHTFHKYTKNNAKKLKANTFVLWYGKKRVTSWELQVKSLKARVEIQKWEFKSTSYKLRYMSQEFKFTSYKHKSKTPKEVV